MRLWLYRAAALYRQPPDGLADHLDLDDLSDLIAWSQIDGPFWGLREDVNATRVVAMLASDPKKIDLPEWDTMTPKGKVESAVGFGMMDTLFGKRAG